VSLIATASVLAGAIAAVSGFGIGNLLTPLLVLSIPLLTAHAVAVLAIPHVLATGEDELRFGKGGVDDAEDAEVILHAYGHAIQDSQQTRRGSAFARGGCDRRRPRSRRAEFCKAHVDGLASAFVYGDGALDGLVAIQRHAHTSVAGHDVLDRDRRHAPPDSVHGYARALGLRANFQLGGPPYCGGLRRRRGGSGVYRVNDR